MCKLDISQVNKVFIIIIITTVEMLTTVKSSSEPSFPVTVSCLFAGGGGGIQGKFLYRCVTEAFKT